MTWNLPTILLGLAVLAVFVAIVAGGIRKRRRGGIAAAAVAAAAGAPVPVCATRKRID